MKKIDKIISLGSTCNVRDGLKNVMPKERYPFDASRTPHQALNNMLKSKFINILFPDKEKLDNIAKVGLYYPYEGFIFGHQYKSEMRGIEEKIKRRCNRFLNLKSYDHNILFIRERSFNIDHENSQENIINLIQDEYLEIFSNLESLGFKNFEFLYIVNSIIYTLDGYITIKNELHDNILFIEGTDIYYTEDLKKWKAIEDIINKKFDLSNIEKDKVNIKKFFGWFGWKSKVTLVLLINLAIAYSFLNIGFNLARTHSISKLPNSCFVDAVTFASNANFILSNENTWAQVYAYQFHYKEELKVDVDFNKTLLEYKVTIPKFHGHAVCIFEHKGILWIYDNNYGTMPVGPAGNRNEYHLRITNWIETKYNVIVFNSILIDDDQGKTVAWIKE